MKNCLTSLRISSFVWLRINHITLCWLLIWQTSSILRGFLCDLLSLCLLVSVRILNIQPFQRTLLNIDPQSLSYKSETISIVVFNGEILCTQNISFSIKQSRLLFLYDVLFCIVYDVFFVYFNCCFISPFHLEM